MTATKARENARFINSGVVRVLFAYYLPHESVIDSGAQLA